MIFFNALPKSILLSLLVIVFTAAATKLQAQSYCSPIKANGGGFYTSIHRVIDNGGSYTITLRIEHNGCDDPECKPLNQYSVEADPGTYSDVYYEIIKGDVSINGINLGPNIAGWNYQGFRVSSINGIGDGQAGVFYITYTLSYLQDQHCMAKAGEFNYEVFFEVSEFQYIIDCPVQPYYLPPDGGKIDPNSKIGPELTALANFPGPYVSDDIFQIVSGTDVIIEAFPMPGKYQALLTLLQSTYGMTNVLPDPTNQSIIGQVPIANLLSLNNVNELDYARPFYPVNMDIGEATSQGDQAMLSDVAKDIFKVGNGRSINGQGIKVGVLSNSYNTNGLADDDVNKWDLPGSEDHPYNTNPVQVLKDLSFETSDEGRAMMHIIHDVAPGADLAFHTGVLGAPDMAAGIKALAAAGCDVIVDDITYISEPFFESGVVAQAISEVVNDPSGNYPQEVSYFTSAGNFGEKSYENSFVGGAVTPPGIYGTPHVFGTVGGNQDIYNQISLPAGKYTFVLQWNDYSSFTETSVDLDIFLSGGEGHGFLGYNKDNVGELALEVLPFNVSVPTTTNIVIVNSTGAPVEFKYVIFRGADPTSVEYTDGNSTITSHANSFDAITVGAVKYSNTPALGGTLTIESFSSKGGPVSYIGGEARPKPDFVAPDGTSTGVPGYESFYGTSAAAPHAAAVAALLQDASQTYNNVSLTANEIRTILSSTAITGPSGVDNIYGYGLIQADAAIQTLANPRSIITGIATMPEDAIPGLQTIIVDVDGEYLINGESVIYFNGQALETSYGATGTTLEATIQPFEELYPPIQVYNPPLDPDGPGLDGGFSDPVFFNEKPTIVGTIQNYTKYYGESLPAGGFTVDYTIHYADGTSAVLDENFEYYNRIMAIPIETGADDDPESENGALANVGTWPIFASYDDPLNPLYQGDPPGPDDAEILYNYSFRFEDGTLTIEKLDLTITPNDMEFTYGDNITGFSYYYNYDRSIIDDDVETEMESRITDAYFADMATDFAFMVDPESISGDLGDLTNKSIFVSVNAIGQALALVNQMATGQALALVNGQALALVNGQALALVNGQALALVNNTDFADFAATNGQALALVNALELVTGQALALVNGQSTATGQALALVNAETILDVTGIPPDWDEAMINGQALALVNGQALALVNGQALALVNGTSIEALFNEEAFIVLTVDDIETATSTGSIDLKSVNLITGNTVTNAGNPHSIIPGTFVSGNLNISYGIGGLTINPAPVTITGNHQVINEGEPEPPYTGYNFVYNGFVMNETESDVFGAAGPSYSTGYVNPPGSPDIYPVSMNSTAYNYTFSFPDPVNLYVNPDGPGTRHVKPKLRCVDEVNPSSNQWGYSYIAYFEYENDNPEYVYVPEGPDNIMTGSAGASWVSQTDQPELFTPGGSNGTAWEVLFNGKKITWTVSSQDHGHPSGVASYASSNSARCLKNGAAPADEVSLAGGEKESRIYPNPANNSIHIDMKYPVEDAQNISVYDIYGKACEIRIKRHSGQQWQLDISGLQSGMYFIRAQHAGGEEVLRFVKR